MTPPRIISGLYKGLRLKPVPGTITRPITDRVKEALFNILGADVHDSHFLDLFAGTGSVGIEALSRGAANVFFIEKDSSAFRTLSENLSKTKELDTHTLIKGDAFFYLEKGFEIKFDYVFIAPPQYKGIWKDMLLSLDKNNKIMTSNAWAIVQIDPTEYEKVNLLHLKEFDCRDYGSTRLIFFINP